MLVRPLLTAAACVALVAAAVPTWRAYRHWAECRRLAEVHRRQEALYETSVRSDTFRAEVFEDPSPANQIRWRDAHGRLSLENPPSEGQLNAAWVAREHARWFSRSAAHHARMARLFRHAATCPWLPMPPDEPGPQYERESRILMRLPLPSEKP